MAASMKVEGIEQLDRMLAELGNRAMEVAKKSLYEGAGVMADAFAAAANSIRTERFKGKKDKRLPSPEEKAAIVGRTGIARFKTNGDEVNTMVGVTEAEGYTKIGGEKKAVRLIARSINSGTSFMDKQPVFRKAKSSARGKATDAMVKKAEELYEEIINGSGN